MVLNIFESKASSIGFAIVSFQFQTLANMPVSARRIAGALIDLDDTLYHSERISALVRKNIRGVDLQAGFCFRRCSVHSSTD